MDIATTTLSSVCSEIRNKIAKITPTQGFNDWMNEVDVLIGAPGINLKSIDKNTLNLFYYKFEPFGFHAHASNHDTQWMRILCMITAVGVADDNDTPDDNDDISAGANELRILSHVMRFFQENPVQEIINGDEQWHLQFIPRSLADEQINQIWSTQGDVIYRPSMVYEIALAAIEPQQKATQSAKVTAIGHRSVADMNQKHSSWQEDQGQVRFPDVPSVTVDITNPQWSPAIAMVTGPNNSRQAHLTLSITVTDQASINIPDIDLWIAGDTSETVKLVGQLLQNGQWTEISIADEPQADNHILDMNNLPQASANNFTLQKNHWTGFDDDQDSWQLQLFAERQITLNGQLLRLRSNPVLISVTTQGGP